MLTPRRPPSPELSDACETASDDTSVEEVEDQNGEDLNEEQRDEDTTTRECGICNDSKWNCDFVSATQDCQHEVDYCTTCLQAWISSSLERNGWDNIRCPESECAVKLGVGNIQQHADRETFEKHVLRPPSLDLELINPTDTLFSPLQLLSAR